MKEPTSIADVFVELLLKPSDQPASHFRDFTLRDVNQGQPFSPKTPASWREARFPNGEHLSPAARELLSLFDEGRIQSMPKAKLVELVHGLMCGIINLEAVAHERLTIANRAAEAELREWKKRSKLSRATSDHADRVKQKRQAHIKRLIENDLRIGQPWPSHQDIADSIALDKNARNEGYAHSQRIQSRSDSAVANKWNIQTIREDVRQLIDRGQLPARKPQKKPSTI